MAFGLFDTARALVLASLASVESSADRRCQLFLRTYGQDFDPVTTSRIIKRLRQTS